MMRIGVPSNGTPIRIIGVNDSWIEDGTYAVFDARGQATNCIRIDDKDGWYWSNLELDDATGSNVRPSSAHVYSHVWLNCYSHDAGSHGWGDDTRAFAESVWIGCRAIQNQGYGIRYVYHSQFVNCQVLNNSGTGIYLGGSGGAVLNCVIHNNGGYGVIANAAPSVISQCVIDGNGSHGVYASVGGVTVAFCSITNNNYGLYGSTAVVHDLWNYFGGNTGDTGGSLIVSTWKGSDTRLTGGQQGYEDPANGIFNRTPGATGYRREVGIGGGNYVRATCGLPTILKRPLGRI